MGYRVRRARLRAGLAWQQTWVPLIAVLLLFSLPQCGSEVGNAGNGGESGSAGANAHGGRSPQGGQSGTTGVSGHAGVGGSSTDAGASGMLGASSDAGASGSVEASACAALPACGGDAVGHWVTGAEGGAAAQPVNACAEPDFVPPTSCTDLDYEPANSPNPGIARLKLPLPSEVLVQGADVNFNANHHYAIDVRTSGDTGLHFTPACLTAHGASPTCADLVSQLNQALSTAPEYSHLACLTAADGGCDCSWTFQLDFLDEGTWQVTGEALSLEQSYQPPAGPLPPRVYDFCEHGDALTLSAHPGTAFIGSDVVGLRTLSLKRTQ